MFTTRTMEQIINIMTSLTRVTFSMGSMDRQVVPVFHVWTVSWAVKNMKISFSTTSSWSQCSWS